ncbi:MAG TPA: acetolactate synthase large subunit [Ferrovibrio sp.]|uniref:acetolactate synthase large subunit n=1 Tax=Ferrovibrio sp. TaxID=1917215 RepID=UPI002B4B3D83|nr:acetolactate synthase large subunit [Ferrovibrio sp.]HLT76730.1 acetolactate synthase large subunit [Ferrovibrio sp.]
MNGAESLVRTLLASDVNVCFANPGTSEMHFVAALDHVPGVRCVLGLFEGVVTGAADGYWRMAGKPAATLLHLGPGLANGVANLHNARKASSGIVNVIGEHATHHLQYDAPLTADIAGIARPVSHWIGTAKTATEAAKLGAEAVAAARTGAGQIASLILPADTAWTDADGPAAAIAPPARKKADDAAIQAAAQALKAAGANGMLMLGGVGLLRRGLELAARIAAATGCRLSNSGYSARMERGGGLPQVGRIPFVVDQALAYLKDVRELVLVGGRTPVAFFAYPGKPSLLLPQGCNTTAVASIDDDVIDALERLADAVGAPKSVAPAAQPPLPALPDGTPTPDKVAAAIAALLPEQAIVVDESVTSGRGIFAAAAASAPHDWLNNMGGSIGFSFPVAVGCALACPDRKVVALTGDGSAFYTLQALWTMAREKLDITMVVFANRSYAILRNELANVGAANPGPRAIDMLTLDRPDPDWVALAKGHGVGGRRVDDMGDFAKAFRAALAEPGPQLIELVL